MVEFVSSCAASCALGILNSYKIFGKNVKAKRSGGSNFPVDISGYCVMINFNSLSFFSTHMVLCCQCQHSKPYEKYP